MYKSMVSYYTSCLNLLSLYVHRLKKLLLNCGKLKKKKKKKKNILPALLT